MGVLLAGVAALTFVMPRAHTAPGTGTATGDGPGPGASPRAVAAAER